MVGIAPTTFSIPARCSASELHGHALLAFPVVPQEVADTETSVLEQQACLRFRDPNTSHRTGNQTFALTMPVILRAQAGNLRKEVAVGQFASVVHAASPRTVDRPVLVYCTNARSFLAVRTPVRESWALA